MKKLLNAATALFLLSLAAPALAGAPKPHDAAAMIKLSQIEARKAMLGLCGVTGDDALPYLAKDTAAAATLEASLSDTGKASLPETRAKIDAGVQTSWDTTPEDQRNKSCEALKATMSK